MSAIRKILVPADFSAHANEALRVAHKLARALGADLILFHVARPPFLASEDGRFLTDLDLVDAINVWDRFQEIQPNDPEVRVAHEVMVAERPCATHILEILDKVGCDLIVMGTHGRSWLHHFLFDSLAEEVVRRAPCPVMVVKALSRRIQPRHGRRK